MVKRALVPAHTAVLKLFKAARTRMDGMCVYMYV